MDATIGKYKFEIMSDEPKTISINQQTLLPISLVIVLLSAGIYAEARMGQMESKISNNTTEVARTQADVKEVRASYLTRQEFVLTLENLNTKLDAIKKAVEK